MRWLLGGALVVALSACYPLYIPPHATMAQLEQAGDVHARAGVGFHGWNLSGAYALTDHISVRAEGNTDFSTDASRGRSYGQVGLGGFWSVDVEPPTQRHPIPSGVRTGLAFDFGVGRSAGSASLTTSSSTSTFVYSVTYLRGSLEGEVSFESEFVGVGLVARLSALNSTPTPENRDATQAFWMMAEPVLALRAGTEHFKVDLQGGVSLPLGGQGNLGGWWPLIMQLGFSGDWGQPRRNAPVESPPPPTPEPPAAAPPAPMLPGNGPPPTPAPEPGAPPVDVPPAGEGPPPTPPPEPTPAPQL